MTLKAFSVLLSCVAIVITTVLCGTSPVEIRAPESAVGESDKVNVRASVPCPEDREIEAPLEAQPYFLPKLGVRVAQVFEDDKSIVVFFTLAKTNERDEDSPIGVSAPPYFSDVRQYYATIDSTGNAVIKRIMNMQRIDPKLSVICSFEDRYYLWQGQSWGITSSIHVFDGEDWKLFSGGNRDIIDDATGNRQADYESLVTDREFRWMKQVGSDRRVCRIAHSPRPYILWFVYGTVESESSRVALSFEEHRLVAKSLNANSWQVTILDYEDLD